MVIYPITTPAGSDGEIQYNDGGIFGAESNLFWDDVNKRLGIKSNTPTSHIEIRDNSGTTTPTLTFYDTDIGLTLDQVLGSIDFYQTDASGPGPAVVAQIQAVADDAPGSRVGIRIKLMDITSTLADKFIFRKNGAFVMTPDAPSGTDRGLDIQASAWNSSEPLVYFSNTDTFPADAASVLQLVGRGVNPDSYYL